MLGVGYIAPANTDSTEGFHSQHPKRTSQSPSSPYKYFNVSFDVLFLRSRLAFEDECGP